MNLPSFFPIPLMYSPDIVFPNLGAASIDSSSNSITSSTLSAMAPNVIVWVASGVTVSRMMILVLRV